jgi:hypothetical protein
MPTRLIASLIAGLVSLPALGQERIPQPFLIELARDLAAIQQVKGPSENPTLRVVGADANVHAAPGLGAQVIGSLNAGTEARVIDKSGDWYEIVMPDQRGWLGSDARCDAQFRNNRGAPVSCRTVSREKGQTVRRNG